MSPLVVSLAIGICVVMLVVAVMMLLQKPAGEEVENRLDEIAGKKVNRKKGKAGESDGGIIKTPTLDEATRRGLAKYLPNLDKIEQLYEAADVNVPLPTLITITIALSVGGGVLAFATGAPLPAVPVAALMLGAMPYLWLRGKKAGRIKKFLEKFPEAMELMGRALRAGHGLASGMHLVSEEMDGPIALEFGRVFDEQNFGVPLEVSLRGMADRVPSMDVRFFVTAVIIQRSTGGDLAEVLDKISKLIRERFELFGHVKALTAEGRLSGMVLMALPPGLVAFLLVANPQYINSMFTTDIGQKMLGITVFMQVLGALMIKKIVEIKV